MRKRNVTITVDEESYRRARVWAAERQTTVSAVVSVIIAHLPGSPVARMAVESLPQRTSSDRPSPQQSDRVTSLIRIIEHLSDPTLRA